MFQSPGEVAFSLFGLPVYFYGVTVAIAVLTGFVTSSLIYTKLYDKSGGEKLIDMAPFLIIFGVVGARLYYCTLNYSYYIIHPMQIFDIRQGGLSIHGMLIVGIITLIILVKKYQLSFLKTADVAACGTVLAQAIGRWGNFFNSEAFGLPCSLPWKLYIPPSHRPPFLLNYDYFHPTFLYESLLDLIIFFILIKLLFKYKGKPGLVFGIYLILYSLARIAVETLRIDSVLNIFRFPIAQLISVLTIIISAFFIMYITGKNKFN